jgi:hypothetical protein
MLSQDRCVAVEHCEGHQCCAPMNWARTTIVTLHYKLGLLNSPLDSYWIICTSHANLGKALQTSCLKNGHILRELLSIHKIGRWDISSQKQTFLNLVENANQIATVSESWARRDWSLQNTLCFCSLVCCNLSCAVIKGLNCLVNICLWSPQISSQISSTSTYTSLSGLIGHQG